MPEEDGKEEQGQSFQQISAEEYQGLVASARSGAAVAAGFDMSNPTADLVLEKHWVPGMTVDALREIGERFNVLVAPPVAEAPAPGSDGSQDFPTRSGPEGADGAGDLLDSLSSEVPSSSAEEEEPADVAASRIVREEMKKGATRKDALAMAMIGHLKGESRKHARDRIEQRKQESGVG